MPNLVRYTGIVASATSYAYCAKRINPIIHSPAAKLQNELTSHFLPEDVNIAKRSHKYLSKIEAAELDEAEEVLACRSQR